MIQDAASLAAAVNARWYIRINGQEAKTAPTTEERPLGAVWRDIASSWRMVKEAVANPPAPNPDLIAQNLQLEESYVTPQPEESYVTPQPEESYVTPQPESQPSASVQRHSSTRSTAGRSRPPPPSSSSRSSQPPPVSSGQRRSSISKFDKDLPPPPSKELLSESGFSFNVDYTESPLSASTSHAWGDTEEYDDDDETGLPRYEDVLLEAYADDPSPPPLVLAFRRGEVSHDNLGLLSGANASLVSLLPIDNNEQQPGTTYHSAVSSAEHSDSEDAHFYSAVPSRRSSFHETTAASEKPEKSDDKPKYLTVEEKKRPYPADKPKSVQEEKKKPVVEKPKVVEEVKQKPDPVEKPKVAEEEKKKPDPGERKTSADRSVVKPKELIEDEKLLEKELEAVADRLKKIVTTRRSLPLEQRPEMAELLTEDAQYALGEINELLHDGQTASPLEVVEE
jgi:hypothetical protein